MTWLVRLCRQLAGVRLRCRLASGSRIVAVLNVRNCSSFSAATLNSLHAADEITFAATIKNTPVVKSADNCRNKLLIAYCEEALEIRQPYSAALVPLPDRERYRAHAYRMG